MTQELIKSLDDKRISLSEYCNENYDWRTRKMSEVSNDSDRAASGGMYSAYYHMIKWIEDLFNWHGVEFKPIKLKEQG